MPVLPFIEDIEKNISEIVDRAIDSGARFIFPRMGVTLRGNQKDWYYSKLNTHFPGLKEEYEAHFGNKIYCNSPNTRKLMNLLRDKCKKYGLQYNMADIIRVSRQRSS